MKTSLTITLLILNLLAFSQIKNSKIDSIKSKLAIASHDTSKLRLLNALANAEENPVLSISYDDQIENIASASDKKSKYIYKKYLANAIHRKGLYYFNLGDYTQAMELYEKSLKLREELISSIKNKNQNNELLECKKALAASLNNIGNIFKNKGDFSKTLEYYNKSLKLRKEVDDKSNIARSYNNIGTVYYVKGDNIKALENYSQCLKICEELDDKNCVTGSLNNIGLLSSYQGDIPKAMECYSRCLKIQENIDDKRGIAISLNNIANLYSDQGDIPKALEYYKKSLKIREDLKDKSNIPGSLNNIGLIYADLKDITKALEYYNKSLKIYEELEDKRGIGMTLGNLALVYYNQGDLNTAFDYNIKSLKIREELGDKSGTSIALYHIGAIYLKRNETRKALDFLQRAYSLTKETGFVEDMRETLKLMEETYAQMGNYKLSRKYYGEYIKMRDSISKEENNKLVQRKYFQYQYEKKATTDSISHSKAIEISNLEIAKQKAESRKQKIVISFTIIGLLLVLIFAAIIFQSLKITRKQKKLIEEQKQLVDEKNNTLNQQNEEIRTQRDEIEAQRDEITAQRDTVTTQKEHIEEIYTEISDSINYAKRIQQAILPDLSEIINTKIPNSKFQENLDSDLDLGAWNLNFESFILFKPKDIVSGDFFWATKIKEFLIVSVADCTGHGVPGAFMSMLGISFLNEIVRKNEITQASQVLDNLRNSIIDALKQKGQSGEQKDGMDLVLVVINIKSLEMQYAGANNPLWIIRNTENSELIELEEIRPDKMPVAIYEKMAPFTNHLIQLQKGDILYLSTDGYEDQFGGPKGKKFLSKNMKELLKLNYFKPMIEQKDILDKTIEEWKNGFDDKYEQIDDITVMSIKIS